MGRPASRLGDADMIHCTVPFRAMGSYNVFINGRQHQDREIIILRICCRVVVRHVVVHILHL